MFVDTAFFDRESEFLVQRNTRRVVLAHFGDRSRIARLLRMLQRKRLGRMTVTLSLKLSLNWS